MGVNLKMATSLLMELEEPAGNSRRHRCEVYEKSEKKGRGKESGRETRRIAPAECRNNRAAAAASDNGKWILFFLLSFGPIFNCDIPYIHLTFLYNSL